MDFSCFFIDVYRDNFGVFFLTLNDTSFFISILFNYCLLSKVKLPHRFVKLLRNTLGLSILEIVQQKVKVNY